MFISANQRIASMHEPPSVIPLYAEYAAIPPAAGPAGPAQMIAPRIISTTPIQVPLFPKTVNLNI
jgi:hypothetical protein